MYKIGKAGLEEIYVVGCGPSLRGFDWQLLKDKTTIAINGSISEVPDPDYFLTADSGMAIRMAIRMTTNNLWGKAPVKILVMAPTHKQYEKVKPYLSFYDRVIAPYSYDGEISLELGKFATGRNSGFCGMQFAVILGAKRIHLLGMDLHTKGGEHYKDDYSRLDVKRLDEFFNNFVRAIGLLREAGVEIVSHSSSSRLNDLIPYEELV